MISERDFRVAERFTRPYLDDIYQESIKLVCLRRAMKKVKRALRQVLNSMEIPRTLPEFMQNVLTELKRQDSLQEIDMQVLANIIEKCFRVQDRVNEMQVAVQDNLVDLDAFIAKVDEQIVRLSESDYDFFMADNITNATKSGILTAETNTSSIGAENSSMQQDDRQSRKNTALRMKSWLMAKQGARQDLRDSF